MTRDVGQAMNKDQYARIVATRPWTTDSARQLIESARAVAEKMTVDRILFDLRSWEAPEKEMMRYESGLHLASLLRPPYRVAALARSEHVNRFAENVAVNRGAAFRVFADEAAALDWLLQGAEKPSQSPGPTSTPVTPRAGARVAPTVPVAHL